MCFHPLSDELTHIGLILEFKCVYNGGDNPLPIIYGAWLGLLARKLRNFIY